MTSKKKIVNEIGKNTLIFFYENAMNSYNFQHNAKYFACYYFVAFIFIK